MKSLQILMMGKGFDQQGKYSYQELDDLISIDGYIPVATIADLQYFTNQPTTAIMGVGTDWEGTYTLGTDKKYVQIFNIDWGDNWSGFADFTGIYDGNEVFINGLEISGAVDASSFIGSATAAIVRNINLTNISGIGGLLNVENSTSGIIENCHVAGAIIGAANGIGGICSRTYGSVSNCTFGGSISGAEFVGGITGVNNGTIEECYALGSVSSSAAQSGGIAGVNQASSIIQNCFSLSDVDATTNYSGGLVGANSGTITNCYSTGSATTDGTIVGGLIGSNSGTVTNSYWDTVASGNATSDGGTGKTTTEMQEGSIPDTAIYVSWDDTIWDAVDDSSYPELINV